MTSNVSRFMFAALMVLTSAPIYAQVPAPAVDRQPRWLEVGVGAALGGLHSVNERPACDRQAVPCTGSAGPSRGGQLTLGGNLRDGLQVIGTVTRYSQLYDAYQPGAHREEMWVVMSGVQAATRFGGGPSPRLTRVFGHVMAGVAQHPLVGLSDPIATGRGWQVGAGVDRRLSHVNDVAMVRAEVDYRVFRGAAEDQSGWLGIVGLAYDLGTRVPARPRPQRRPSRPEPEAGPLGEVPTLEVAAGVSAQGPKDVNLPPLCSTLNLPCGSPRTFPDFGLSFSAARHLADWLGLVGEVDVFGNQWRETSSREGQRINHVQSALAGVRIGSPRLYAGASRYGLRVFGQVLAGPQWSSVAPERRAIQAGLGIDTSLPNGIAVRWQFDYCHAPGPVRDLSTGRAVIAAVFGF